MNKREKYNRRAVRKYRNRNHLKNALEYFSISAGVIFFTIAIAEPYRNEGLNVMIIRMCSYFLLGGVFCYIGGKLHYKKIKSPTITHKRPLKDHSKDMQELALRYEVIPEPEKTDKK